MAVSRSPGQNSSVQSPSVQSFPVLHSLAQRRVAQTAAARQNLLCHQIREIRAIQNLSE